MSRTADPLSLTLSVPEFDAIWRSDPEALRHVAGMFPSAPFIDVGVQRLAGHCVDLHLLAQTFYMKVIAFAQECSFYHFVAHNQ